MHEKQWNSYSGQYEWEKFSGLAIKRKIVDGHQPG